MNITLLLGLVLFVFGIIGMQLFGGLPQGNPMEEAINTFDNFDTVLAAMRVLFQIATGQDWVSKAEELELKMLDAGYVGGAKPKAVLHAAITRQLNQEEPTLKLRPPGPRPHTHALPIVITSSRQKRRGQAAAGTFLATEHDW